MKLSHSILIVFISSQVAYALPSDFVYLKNVDPTILQEMRYAGYHNFVGRPVKGYEASTCILTKQAAQALSLVQQQLLKKSLSLKVYDCYRPTMAVADFMAWSKDAKHVEMKKEFYPAINKADVFSLGYVAEKSGHSRGSTVDLTIVPIPTPKQTKYKIGQPLFACTASVTHRFRDNSLDMGTGYDCMDTLSYPGNTDITTRAYQNRMVLRQIMLKNQFQPYEKEWWHFTLDNEPYPQTYFNFRVS